MFKTHMRFIFVGLFHIILDDARADNGKDRECSTPLKMANFRRNIDLNLSVEKICTLYYMYVYHKSVVYDEKFNK